MRLHIPSRLIDLLATFAQVQLAFENLEPDSLSWLEPRFRAKFAPTWQRLRGLGERQARLKAAWTAALEQRRHQFSCLDRMVRDSWLLLRRRDQREGQAGLLVLIYHLPKCAPQHASTAVWLEHARNLIHGDAYARSLGHAPLAFPSASELETCFAQASAAEERFVALSFELKALEDDLRQAQREAAHLLRCLGARIRESQFDRPASETRALMRNFGFSFKATPADAYEEVQVPVAVTTSNPAAAPAVASPAASCPVPERVETTCAAKAPLRDEAPRLAASTQGTCPSADAPLRWFHKLVPNLARSA